MKWLAVVLLIVACRRPAPPASLAVIAQARTYVGSETCADCHSKAYKRWQNDWHARALSKAGADTVVGRFDNAHYKGASTEAWMTRRADKYVMRTADREGKVAEHAVDWLIGGKRMQDAVTVFPDGRWQVLPAYFHVTGGGAWVDYNAAKQGPVGRDHPFFWTNFRRTANHECLECHTTGLDVRYDRAQWSTRFADAGVGCEACHGPGSRHAESADKADIAMPGTATCAHCHGPREPLFPFLDATHAFTPGAKYEDFYQPAGLVDGDSRSGEFFVDGRPSSSSYEWQALMQSKCHRQGGATCTTCHAAPHAEHGDNELKADTCQSCHAKVSAGHTSHRQQACTTCHMAKTITGVLDTFADHSLDIPVPENTTLHDIPNACGTCHKDKTSEALAQTIHQWWPQSTRRLRRMRLADAFDEKSASKSGPALVGVLRDTSEAPLLRGFAAELIGQRFAKDAARLLVPFLHESDALLRTKVLLGLTAADARAAADAVATCLDDPSLFVRQASAVALAGWGDARAVAALQTLTHDKSASALVRPHLALAQTEARAHHFAAARAEVEAALALMPYLPAALIFEADLAMRDGDVATARTAIDSALRFDPQNRAALQRQQSLPR